MFNDLRCKLNLHTDVVRLQFGLYCRHCDSYRHRTWVFWQRHWRKPATRTPIKWDEVMLGALTICAIVVISGFIYVSTCLH